MAVADADEELGSTLSWASSLLGRYFAGIIVWGMTLLAFASPALLFVPDAVPESGPFLYLALAGLVIGLLKPDFPDDKNEQVTQIVENFQKLSGPERYIYFATILVLAIGVVSSLVGVIGVVASVLASQLNIALPAVAFAVWYPPVDAWLGAKTGYNVSSIGGFIALAFMYLIAKLYRVSPEVPRAAATDFRRELRTL
jgi:hypothetical protein